MDKQDKPSPVEEEMEEVEIEEAEDGSEDTQQEPAETPSDEPQNDEPEGGEEGDGEDEAPAEECALGEADVAQLLEGVRLPEKVKELLAHGQYADEAALMAEVDAVKEAFIVSTGAGRPTATGDNSPKVRKSRAELMQERETAQDAINSKFLMTRTRVKEETSND